MVQSAQPLQPFIPLVEALATRLNPLHREELIQEGLLALDRALQQDPEAMKSFALIRTVISRAQWRALMRWGNDPSAEPMEIAPAQWHDILREADVYLNNIPYGSSKRVEHEIDEDLYFAAVEERLGSEARRVAENLVEPRDPAVCALIIAEVQRKLRARVQPTVARKERGCKRTVRVSHRHVRLGLGMKRAKWNQLLEQIRTFTRQWLHPPRAS